MLESFHHLKSAHDLVIVEGAGSPAEVNLSRADIANMGFVHEADVPVVVAGDIDRGVVIAQFIGTQTVIDENDAAMITGFLINKFRGDLAFLRAQGWDIDLIAHVRRVSQWPFHGQLPARQVRI